MDSDGKSDLLKNHWGDHFKRLHEEGKISINTFNISNNHLHILHHHHLHRHGDKIFPYFDIENMKFVKDRIKGIAKTKMNKIEAKTKEVMAAERKILDAEK